MSGPVKRRNIAPAFQDNLPVRTQKEGTSSGRTFKKAIVAGVIFAIVSYARGWFNQTPTQPNMNPVGSPLLQPANVTATATVAPAANTTAPAVTEGWGAYLWAFVPFTGSASQTQQAQQQAQQPPAPPTTQPTPPAPTAPVGPDYKALRQGVEDASGQINSLKGGITKGTINVVDRIETQQVQSVDPKCVADAHLAAQQKADSEVAAEAKKMADEESAKLQQGLEDLEDANQKEKAAEAGSQAKVDGAQKKFDAAVAKVAKEKDPDTKKTLQVEQDDADAVVSSLRQQHVGLKTQHNTNRATRRNAFVSDAEKRQNDARAHLQQLRQQKLNKVDTSHCNTPTTTEKVVKKSVTVETVDNEFARDLDQVDQQLQALLKTWIEL